MTAEYVHIHYAEGEEVVPLKKRADLKEILSSRGSFLAYEIRPAWWYRLAFWWEIQRGGIFPQD
jgi:hypothetical protein